MTDSRGEEMKDLGFPRVNGDTEALGPISEPKKDALDKKGGLLPRAGSKDEEAVINIRDEGTEKQVNLISGVVPKEATLNEGEDLGGEQHREGGGKGRPLKDAIMNVMRGRVSAVYLVPSVNVVQPGGDPTNDRRREAILVRWVSR